MLTALLQYVDTNDGDEKAPITPRKKQRTTALTVTPQSKRKIYTTPSSKRLVFLILITDTRHVANRLVHTGLW